MYKILFLLTIILTEQGVEVLAQARSNASIFTLINSSRKKNNKFIDFIKGSGRVQYRDSTISGELLFSKGGVQIQQNQILKWFSYKDTLLQKIIVNNYGDNVLFNRLAGYDNQLWRLVKDTLGISIYDKSYSPDRNTSSIDYNSLLFQQDAMYIPAVTFWTTSTKRSIIKIVNKLLGLNLSPKNFKGKEDLMNMLVSN
ncbi:MAG: hypothetical protein KF825_06490 [Ferruginibacter sp.]|nr:hypothetical protein [Ferruginibacter sp.]